MSCPICGTPESATITEGIRAGAVVLMAVAAVVVGAVARFGWRLWRLQQWGQPPLRWGQPFRVAQEPPE